MMKHTRQLRRIGLALTLLLFFCAGHISAQKKSTPKTVVDYFMLLPEKHLSLLKYHKNRRRAIEKFDVKNGWLEVKRQVFDGESVEAQVALFRKSNGAAVIAVALVSCGMDYCMGGLHLLTYDGKRWTDVTENLLPEFSDPTLIAAFNRVKLKHDRLEDGESPPIYYKLPRRGTTILLLLGGDYASTDQPLFYLEWNGERFVTRAK